MAMGIVAAVGVPGVWAGIVPRWALGVAVSLAGAGGLASPEIAAAWARRQVPLRDLCSRESDRW
jgi:hypothetical protein